MENYSKICKLYEDGYKCIKYDDEKDGPMNIYLKNFEIEKSDTIKVTDFQEKMRIKNYINQNTLN